MLAVIQPDPVIMLNRLAVIYKIDGVQAALSEIEHSPFRSQWEKHYLYHSLLGEMYSDNDPGKAIQSFEKAMALTRSQAEQKLISRKVAGLRSHLIL